MRNLSVNGTRPQRGVKRVHVPANLRFEPCLGRPCVQWIHPVGGAGIAHASQALRQLLDLGDVSFAACGVFPVQAEQQVFSRGPGEFETAHCQPDRAIHAIAPLHALEGRDSLHPGGQLG